MLSFWGEKVDNLDDICKVWVGTIDATHLPNGAMEHETIVVSRHSLFCPFSGTGLGLEHGRWADELFVLALSNSHYEVLLHLFLHSRRMKNLPLEHRPGFDWYERLAPPKRKLTHHQGKPFGTG
jgi:hypothetical protein